MKERNRKLKLTTAAAGATIKILKLAALILTTKTISTTTNT